MGVGKARLAKAVGAHPVSMSRWLSGRTPDVPTVMRLAAELGVRFQWLLTGEEPMLAADLPEHAASPLDTMRAARLKAGLTFGQLAKITRYRSDVLQAIEEGRGKASERMIEAVCGALGLEKSLLMGDQIAEANGVSGTYGAKPDVVTVGDVGPPRYVPLISMAQAGTMGPAAFTDGAYQYDGTLMFDVRDNRAFGVRISGDSMAPVYSAGDIAVVYPSSTPRSGDLVIARLADHAGGDVLFKLYTPRDGGHRVALTSYNPAYPPAEFSRQDLLWIYPVVAVTKILRP